MKRVAVVVLLVWAGTVGATEYEIAPKHDDLFPDDGFMDAGTFWNPYVITSQGQEIAELHPKMLDLFPGDGILDAGTSQNPYVLDIEE